MLLTSSQIYHHLSDRTLTPLELFMNNEWPSSTILTGLNDLVPGWPSAAPKTHRAAAKPKAKASSSSTPLSRPRSRSHGPPPSAVELASKKRKAGAGRKKQCSSTALDLAANGMCLSDLFLIMYTSVLSTDWGMFENKPDFNATFQTTLDDQRGLALWSRWTQASTDPLLPSKLVSQRRMSARSRAMRTSSMRAMMTKIRANSPAILDVLGYICHRTGSSQEQL